MKSTPRLVATAMTLLSEPLAGCVHTVIYPDALRCSDLLPSSWLEGVPGVMIPEGVKLPDGHDDARPWQGGFVGQTGQLEMANGRYADGVGIVKRCEDRNAAALKAAKPKFLGVF